MAEVIYPPQWSDERYCSAYRQGFGAGVASARINARQRDPEYAELQRWALEQADRADAAEALLTATGCSSDPGCAPNSSESKIP